MNGILIADKPAGFTSFDLIAKLRGVLQERRLGHGGTLDPMATGVLPVFVGTATKAADLLPNGRKRYIAQVRLGVKTDSGDCTGSPVAQDDRRVPLPALQAAAREFLGAGEQIPPMVSAVRVQGRRLYELARAGQTVARKARPIEIYSIGVSPAAGEPARADGLPERFMLEVECSRGTYIRTLAEDIAARCGCLATLAGLRRTMSAGFTLAQAHPLEEIEAAAAAGRAESLLLPVDAAFAAHRALTLDEPLARLFLNGVRLAPERLPEAVHPGERVRVYRAGVFLGLGEAQDGGFKKIKQFWFEQQPG